MLKGVTSTFINNCNEKELTYNEYIILNNTQIPVRAKLSDDSYDNGNFIGSFILKTIQFETSNEYNFKNKEFEYYKVVNNESIKIGTFITTEVEDNDTTEIVKVVGMDYGLKAQVQYISGLDYASGNITLLDVWNEACELSGLESGVQWFENSDFIVDSDQFSGTGAMIRDVFVGIALSSGSFIKVMNDDKIYPIFKTHTEDLLTTTINNTATIENVLEKANLQLQGNTTQPTYTGKNLFNKSASPSSQNGTSTKELDTGIRATVTTAGTNKYTAIKLPNPSNLLGKTLTLSANISISGTNSALIRFYWANGNTLTNLITNTISTTGSYTFTIPSSFPTNTNGIAIVFSSNAGSSTSQVGDYVDYKNVQIEQGSTQTSYEPYVGNQQSPSPDYPQPIDNVTGRQTIDVVGKNFFDKDKSCNYKSNNDVVEVNINTGKKISWTSSTSSTYKFVDYAIMDLTNFVGKTIRFKCNFNASGSNIAQYYIGLCDKDGNNRINKSQTTTSGTTLNFTVPELSGEQKYLCLALYVNTTGTLSQNDYVEYTNMMLTIDDEDMTYEEYKGQSYEINLGKNLFDKDNANVLNAYFNTSTNKLTQSGAGVKSLYIPCKPNTTYTVQKTLSTRFGVACTREIPVIGETIYNASVHATWNNITITTDSQAKYLVVEYYISSDTLTPEEIMDTIQIETGSQATSYSPYFTPIELNKIGNYQDRIYKENGTWYIEKNIGKAIIDGTSGTFSNPSANRFNIDDLITDFKKIDISNLSFSNYYKSYYQVGTNGQFNELVENVNYGFDFSSSLLSNTLRFKNTDITSVNDFKTWLSTHNTIVYYVLSTPTYTEITNTDLINQLESISLLKGLNNISISGDLAGILKLDYWNNNSEIIEDYTNLEDKRDTHPISCVRLGMSQIDGENVDLIDDDLVAKYGENWLILNDNPFAYNQSKREQLITAIFNKVKGFGYSAFVSKTSFKPYLTCGDTVKFRNRNGDLVDSILLRYSHEYKENDMQIQLEAPSETSATVNYIYPLSAVDINKRTQIEVDKDKGQITNLTEQTALMQDNLSNNFYTKSEADILIQTAQTGLTNTFSEAGGNNIFRNTGLWFEQNDDNNPYEFWNGIVGRISNDKASNNNSLLLQTGTLYQDEQVPDGKYTVSFKYKKLINLANVKCVINDTEYTLSETTDTEFIQTIEVNNQHIKVQFISDTDNACEVYDLMVNAGEVKLAYSQNQNETTTDTVNISKGITITSSDNENIVFKANYDGVRIYEKNNMTTPKTKFTDKGTETNYLEAKDEAVIVDVLIQRVGSQTWLTKI